VFDTRDVCQEKIKSVVLSALILIEEALLGAGLVFQLDPVTNAVDLDEDIQIGIRCLVKVFKLGL
jgi:hypothetical protein